MNVSMWLSIFCMKSSAVCNWSRCFSVGQTACQVDITQESQCPMATECLNKEDKKVLFNESQTGSEVVQAVISKLYCLQILMCDHRLLRRIALVETNDGINDVPDGGIWALSKSKFDDVASDVEKVLRDKLCLYTTDGGVSYTFLRQPFISGLAAALYLNFANAHIPLARHIWEQAHFWMKYYHSRELTAKHFTEQVKTRERK